VRFRLVTDAGSRASRLDLVGAAACVRHTGLEPRAIRPHTSGLADPVLAAAPPNQKGRAAETWAETGAETEAGAEAGAETEACVSMVEGGPVWRRELAISVPAELDGAALRLGVQLMTRELGEDAQASAVVGPWFPPPPAAQLGCELRQAARGAKRTGCKGQRSAGSRRHGIAHCGRH
jgi:hypothetical protein